MNVQCGESLNNLKQQVLNFEANEIDLINAPQQLIEEFGYPCLSNSLLFKEPEIPKYNEEEISQYVKTNDFDSLDSLVSYIDSLDNDIDKLFAIFSYEATHIQLDTKACFSGKANNKTLEQVFESNRAVSSGYATFFIEMAERINIDKNKIEIKEYSNFSREYNFNPLNPPKEAKQNHSSIYISIDGVPFISEPTFASGSITSNKKFEPNYDPQLFLIPLFKSLCSHYPCGESQNLLPFEISFEDFLKSCVLKPFCKSLKTESNPFINFECKNGYVEQIYSCKGPVNNISITLYQKNDKKFTEISSEGITSYEIVQPKLNRHQDRCRFRTNISFPEEGIFKVDLFIDSTKVLTYFVNNLVKCTISVPVTFNVFHDAKFIPIIPRRVVSSVRRGVALIRLAVSSERSTILWDIKKLSDENGFSDEGEIINREFGRYIKLTIPFDDDLYEDQLCISFPSNGRYKVSISLFNDFASFEHYTNYFFDVAGAPPEDKVPVSPVNFLFSGRTFAPEKFVDGDLNEILIKPNQNCYLIDKKDQSILIKTNSDKDSIRLEMKNENETVAVPEFDGKEDDFMKFKWSIPGDFGEYHLIGWINDKLCLNLTFVYRNAFLREPSKLENELMKILESKVDLDDEKAMKKRQLKLNDGKKADEFEGKNDSKCCLLI